MPSRAIAGSPIVSGKIAEDLVVCPVLLDDQDHVPDLRERPLVRPAASGLNPFACITKAVWRLQLSGSPAWETRKSSPAAIGSTAPHRVHSVLARVLGRW